MDYLGVVIDTMKTQGPIGTHPQEKFTFILEQDNSVSQEWSI